MALISVSNNALQNITTLPASVPSGALVLLSTQTASSSASAFRARHTEGGASDWEVIKAKETGSTLSAGFKAYRQALRDITEGLTTVEEVNAVQFPTKP